MKKQLTRKITDIRPLNMAKIMQHKLSLNQPINQINNKEFVLPHHKYCRFVQQKQFQLKQANKQHFKLQSKQTLNYDEDNKYINETFSNSRSNNRNYVGSDTLAMNSIQIQRQQSICPSIENGMMQGYLQNLKDQIKIKSDAMTIAENLIRTTIQENNSLIKQNSVLKQKIERLQKKLEQAESQLQAYVQKSKKVEQSTPLKRSITKTYITQRNISAPTLDSQPLQLISGQIFNQFIVSYQSLINQLTDWINKEQTQQIQNNLSSKINTHCIQVQDFLYGKSDEGEQYSKTTYQTLCNENKYSFAVPQTAKKSSVQLNQFQIQQIIELYRQQITRQSMLLFESVNYIQQLSKSLQRMSNNSSNKKISPRTLIPSQLIRIIKKECNKIINQTFRQLKEQNLELVTVMNQMIMWIRKNCKNSHEILRSYASSQS